VSLVSRRNVRSGSPAAFAAAIEAFTAIHRTTASNTNARPSTTYAHVRSCVCGTGCSALCTPSVNENAAPATKMNSAARNAQKNRSLP
jgi:hypothetical protein